jgi:hypothetical protein
MKNLQPDMDVGKQRRKFATAMDSAPSQEHVAYLEGLRELFDQSIERGEFQPFSNFLPMYEEEFDL